MTGETSPSNEPPQDWWVRDTHEVIAGMALFGEPVPTGCAFIDRNMRHEGVPPGKLFGVGGPPQAGKSHLLAQFMRHIGRTHKVYALMADAGADDTAVTIGALAGLDKTQIEKNPSEASQKVKDLLEGTTIHFVNPEHPEATLTRFLDFVAEDCPAEETPVAFVDSAQVVRHGVPQDEIGEATKAQLVGMLCRRFVIRRRAICFLSSKANRAFFRNRNKADNATAISSFMDGDYEYTFDAAIVLSRPDKETGLIGLEWAKNRLGPPSPPDSSLRWDKNTSALVELDEAELDAAEINRKTETLRPIKLKIKSALRGQPPLSKNAIYDLVKGNRADVFLAIEVMASEKTIDAIPTPSGASFRYKLISRESSSVPLSAEAH